MSGRLVEQGAQSERVHFHPRTGAPDGTCSPRRRLKRFSDATCIGICALHPARVRIPLSLSSATRIACIAVGIR